ncbi:MAG: EamA family transporter RarD [Acidobacteriota bacterium]
MSSPSESARGALYALAAYGAWGLSPLFWKQFGDVPPEELLAHRVVWAMVVFYLLLRAAGRGKQFFSAWRDRATVLAMLASSALIGCNWFLYIWSVTHEHIVEASLGYFINPLVNVVLGTIFLKERLRPLQWVAVLLAASGVLLLTVSVGRIPWIALTLAGSFGIYGLVRKTAPVDALLGSNLETSLLAPLGAGWLIWMTSSGQIQSGGSVGQWGWLLGTGLMTALPLLWFSNAARRLPLSILGFFQYIAPTGQLLLGVLLYNEPFSAVELRSFVMIWSALALLTIETWMHSRRPANAA